MPCLKFYTDQLIFSFWGVSSSVWAVITKSYRQDGSATEMFCSQFWRLGSPRIKAAARSHFVKGPLSGSRLALSRCVLTWWKRALWDLFHKSIHEGGLHSQDLLTSQKPHPWIPWTLEVRILTWIGWGRKYSEHSKGDWYYDPIWQIKKLRHSQVTGSKPLNEEEIFFFIINLLVWMFY